MPSSFSDAVAALFSGSSGAHTATQPPQQQHRTHPPSGPIDDEAAAWRAHEMSRSSSAARANAGGGGWPHPFFSEQQFCAPSGPIDVRGSSGLRPIWCLSIVLLVWLSIMAFGSMLWWSTAQSPASLALLNGARLSFPAQSPSHAAAFPSSPTTLLDPIPSPQRIPDSLSSQHKPDTPTHPPPLAELLPPHSTESTRPEEQQALELDTSAGATASDAQPRRHHHRSSSVKAMPSSSSGAAALAHESGAQPAHQSAGRVDGGEEAGREAGQAQADGVRASKQGQAKTGHTPDGHPCVCSSERQQHPAPHHEVLGAVGVPAQLQIVPVEELRARFDPAHNPRYIDIGSWRHSKPQSGGRITRQTGGDLKNDMQLFVRPGLNTLALAGAHWLLMGFSAPDHAMEMAAGGMTGRRKLLSTFQTAKELGLNTVRVLAFNDGHTRPYALQVMPGVLDTHVLSEGLDWIVWQARHFGLRVLLVQNSASSPVRGGMSQYVRWVSPSGTANNFYSSDTLRALYYDYITALATHVNQFTGLAYREDPTILGWDIMEGARDPQNKGEALQAWIPAAANFLRSMDANHLVMLGNEGLFGPASPHHTHLNPPLAHGRLPWLLYQGGSSGWGDWGTALPPMHLATQFSACEGVDFQRNSILSELDVSATDVAPDAWLSCSDECKLQWTHDWLVSHLRDALRIQRPLLVTAVLSHGPPSRREALLDLVINVMSEAAAKGLPVAGVIVPLPSRGSEGCDSSSAGYAATTDPGCYSGMWHLQEPKIGQQPSPQMPSSAATHNRGRRLSSLPDWNDFVTSDFSTTPDDEDACICDESSSAGMMPLPGNARSVQLAFEAAALRAYWHAFMGGDGLIACIEQAASSVEQSEDNNLKVEPVASRPDKPDEEEAWPLSAAVMGLIEEDDEDSPSQPARQRHVPKKEAAAPKHTVRGSLPNLVVKMQRATDGAGPVELLN